MCFNASTSLATFSLSFFLSSYLIVTGTIKKKNIDIYFGIISILIGIMQLLEYFIWKHQNCGKINHLLSLCIIILLYLQGIVSYFFYMYLFSSYSNNNILIFIFILFFYSLFTLYLLNYLNQYKLCSKPSKNSCRLIWAPYYVFSLSNYNILLSHIFHFFYFGIILYLLFQNKPIQNYPLRFLFLPITLIIAVIYSYHKEGYNYGDIFGSVWCFMAVFLPLVYILNI
jgi:hypothetical protein